MTLQAIALHLIPLRGRALNQASLREALGYDNLREALRRRWLQADEQGFLTVATMGNPSAELESLSAQGIEALRATLPPTVSKWANYFSGKTLLDGKAALAFQIPDANSRQRFIQETGAKALEDGTCALPEGQEAAAQAPVAWRAFMPAQEAQVDPAPGIGDEVVVAEGGKTYTAAVQAKNPDGTYKLSFGPTGRPGRDAFKPTELRVTKRGTPTPAAAPQSPLAPVPVTGLVTA